MAEVKDEAEFIKKVFEMTADVYGDGTTTAAPTKGIILGLDWDKLLRPYVGHKIRITIEEVKKL